MNLSSLVISKSSLGYNSKPNIDIELFRQVVGASGSFDADFDCVNIQFNDNIDLYTLNTIKGLSISLSANTFIGVKKINIDDLIGKINKSN
ncbi:MAG: hypothetical protein ABIQ02_10020 [Saprospiraceae bacterium]